MEQALELAQKAAALGEVPVGALIVDPQGEVLGTGYNLKESQQTATRHAEILAIEAANQKLGSWRLEGCTLYVTLEPCPMCTGAIWASRLQQVIYGASDPKSGYCHSLYELGKDSRLNHRFEAQGGILEEACSQILKDFFKTLRK
ncbi:MAG: nucleoside deaminase [Bdellovibrionaceae bacterium]|nr:nucleoside deaminase [Pseudobdellovibrionaceae bacterium]